MLSFDAEMKSEGESGPFQGILRDIEGRRKCYKQDWIRGIKTGIR